MPTRSTASLILQALTQGALTSGVLGSAAQAILTRDAITSGAEDAKAAAADAVRWMLITAVLGLCAAVGAGLLLTAAYLLLRERMGAVIAFAALGTALWLMAGALLLYSRRVKSKPEPMKSVGTDVFVEIKKFSAQHPFLLVAAAFGVGLILAQPAEAIQPPSGPE